MVHAENNGTPNGRNWLLALLPPADLALLSPYLKDVTVKQGALLQEAGEPIDFVYFPHSGMISVLAVMQSGNGIETATIGREGAVNALAGFGVPNAAGRAVQQIEGTSSRIAASHFRTAVNDSAGIRDLIARYTDLKMTQILQSAGCNALHSVQARLCRWLLQTRDRADSDTLALTQEFLSEMLGVNRTTVTVLARALQDEGLINYRRGKVALIDRPRLEKRVCECYAAVRRKTDVFFSTN
ncbi:MAG TPA: Crp/Fnr family transcriptional regulator [Methylocella sp.]